MITPNKHGVYVEGLERLEHTGKHSKAAILLAHCEDGKWRFGYSADLRDTFETSSGTGGAPSRHGEFFDSRSECLTAAVEFLRECLSRDWNNPNAVGEVRAWLDRLSPPKEGQLALFGAAS